MSTLRALARVLAAERQFAQPICTVRHVHISDRPLVVVPLALSGEACAPLAAMVGNDPREPRLLIVPEPRDRDQRFAFRFRRAEGLCAAARCANATFTPRHLPVIEDHISRIDEFLDSGRGHPDILASLRTERAAYATIASELASGPDPEEDQP